MNLIAAKRETKVAAVLFPDHMIIIKALFLYDKWPKGEESTKMSIDHHAMEMDQYLGEGAIKLQTVRPGSKSLKYVFETWIQLKRGNTTVSPSGDCNSRLSE